MISLPRIFAALTIIVLFTLTIAVAILGTQYVGTQITHGNMVEHKHGTVLSTSETGNSLVFKTDSDQVMNFVCSERCLTELGHMQRHIHEHAPTDIYYRQENNTFIAVDVD